MEAKGGAYEMPGDTVALLRELDQAEREARAAARRILSQMEAILDREREAAGERADSWAREVLDDPATVILDSETTGLSSPVDFVEIAAVDATGKVLFEGLLRPVAHVERSVERTEDGGVRVIRERGPPVMVSEGAARVHGIGPERLRGAPSFVQVWPELRNVLRGRRVVVYNASYDGRVWSETVERYRLDPEGLDARE